MKIIAQTSLVSWFQLQVYECHQTSEIGRTKPAVMSKFSTEKFSTAKKELPILVCRQLEEELHNRSSEAKQVNRSRCTCRLRVIDEQRNLNGLIGSTKLKAEKVKILLLFLLRGWNRNSPSQSKMKVSTESMSWSGSWSGLAAEATILLVCILLLLLLRPTHTEILPPANLWMGAAMNGEDNEGLFVLRVVTVETEMEAAALLLSISLPFLSRPPSLSPSVSLEFLFLSIYLFYSFHAIVWCERLMLVCGRWHPVLTWHFGWRDVLLS